jgi:tRNA(Ile)-lysidine synthase
MGDNHDVTDRVARTIEHYRMAASGRRIVIAVSGGADSVFLLHALHELSLAAAIVHINHHLRGAESDADEAFVRDLSHRFNLPLHVLDAPIDTGNIEQEARRARYDFFQTQIAGGNCDAVATGHTLDDQAETVLYRFIRGAGTAGLSGILPVTQSDIIRPLIELRRTEIRAWLAERQILWREDSSNSDTDFVRNRIRAHHLPELTASLNPALPEALAATASWARAEEDYWNAELERLAPLHLTRAPETVLINTKPFLELPVAVQRRLLRHAIENVRGSLRGIDFRHVEAIRAMMFTREGSGRIQLPDLDIYRSFDWLRFAPIGYDARLERDFEAPLAVPGLTEVPERLLTIETELARKSPVYNEGGESLDRERSESLNWEPSESLDWDCCSGGLALRNWRPGDQYQRRGSSGAEKIKTLFQEFRIPLWERRRWPVIVRGSSILWTRKFGVADEFAAGPESVNILTIREVMESNLLLLASMQMSTSTNRNTNKVNRARRLAEPGAGACKEVS